MITHEVLEAVKELRETAFPFRESKEGGLVQDACAELLELAEQPSIDAVEVRELRLAVTMRAAMLVARMCVTALEQKGDDEGPLDAEAADTVGRVVGVLMFCGAIIAGKKSHSIGDG